MSYQLIFIVDVSLYYLENKPQFQLSN